MIRPTTVEKFYTAHNCRSEKVITERLNAISEAEAVTGDEAIAETYKVQMLVIVEHIRLIQDQIKKYDKLY